VIETYAFSAAFTVQILGMSLLFPPWLIRYCLLWPAAYPESFEKMYPGIERSVAFERYSVSMRRFAAVYLGANTLIAVLGVLLLAWLFRQMQVPDWDEASVIFRTLGYFMLQASPLLVLAVYSIWYMRKHNLSLPEPKRKASLQRRGLFDFVSPSVVAISVLAYFLFVAFVIYLWQDRLSGIDVLVWIGIVTLVYALDVFTLYKKLYGRKNRLEPQEGRADRMAMGIRLTVYINITVVSFLFIMLVVTQQELKKWAPFALSAFFVILTLLISRALAAPRKPEAGGIGSSSEVPS